LTSQDAQDRTVLRAAQPETVKDYTVKVLTATGETRTVAEVKGNFQRLKRHKFEAVEAKSVRVEIAATNGAEEARVFEVRCYA